MRCADITRKTGETDIKLSLDLDGKGTYKINTGCGFLNHMLELFSKHGSFDLVVECKGDTKVDYHHTTEDIGIVLGKAFKQALSDAKGIKRYGNMLLPMDEALVLSAVDVSGRGYLVFNVNIPTAKVGDFDTELVEEFFGAFCRNADITLNIRSIDGTNSHHIIEAAFKATARAIKDAVAIDEKNPNQIPSTKGII